MLRCDNATHESPLCSLFISSILSTRFSDRLCKEEVSLFFEFMNILVYPVLSRA